MHIYRHFLILRHAKNRTLKYFSLVHNERNRGYSLENMRKYIPSTFSYGSISLLLSKITFYFRTIFPRFWEHKFKQGKKDCIHFYRLQHVIFCLLIQCITVSKHGYGSDIIFFFWFYLLKFNRVLFVIHIFVA